MANTSFSPVHLQVLARAAEGMTADQIEQLAHQPAGYFARMAAANLRLVAERNAVLLAHHSEVAAASTGRRGETAFLQIVEAAIQGALNIECGPKRDQLLQDLLATVSAQIPRPNPEDNYSYTDARSCSGTYLRHGTHSCQKEVL